MVTVKGRLEEGIAAHLDICSPQCSMLPPPREPHWHQIIAQIEGLLRHSKSVSIGLINNCSASSVPWPAMACQTLKNY